LSEPVGPSDADFEPVNYKADDIGCMILEPLTKGLYADPRHVLREYIQNEVDSKPAAKEIHIRIEGRNVSVLGTGAGMDEDELNIARKIGFSIKNPKEDVGFRGIGVWSAVGYVRQILISTKKKDTHDKLLLRINAEGLRKEIESRSKKALTQVLGENVAKAKDWDPRKHSHYTHVQLVDVADRRLLDVDSVIEYSRRVLPVGFDEAFPQRTFVAKELTTNVPDYKEVRVWVNLKEIKRPPFYKDLDPPKTGLIQRPKLGSLGWYWVSFNKESRQIPQSDSWGIIFKMKGFTIGDRQLTIPLFPGKAPLVPPWSVGEIHVLSSDLLPDAERTNFVPSELREEFLSAVKEVFISFDEEIRKKSHLQNVAEALNLVKTQKSPMEFDSQAEFSEKQVMLSDLRKKLKNYRNHRWTPDNKKAEIDEAAVRIDKIISSMKVKVPISVATSIVTVTSQGETQAEATRKSSDTTQTITERRTEAVDSIISSVMSVIGETVVLNSRTLKTIEQKLRAKLSALF
jgi:Histidine kinase-, DNA gyrase B-, and HSP90-like ATPase